MEKFESDARWFIGQLDSSKTTQSSGMFKVPQKLLDVRKSAFLPEIFSFGPYHHWACRVYKDLKWRHLSGLYGGKVREISGSKMTDKDIESQSPIMVRFREIHKAAFNLYEKTKECYKDYDYGWDLFDSGYGFRTLVLDGCFIVELLRWYKFMTDDVEEEQLDACGRMRSDSPIFHPRYLLPTIHRDLIKLENQFPFFILEEFFPIITSGSHEPSSLKDLFVKFFCSMFSLDEFIYKLDPNPARKYAHPLDLFRSLFIFSIEEKQVGSKDHKIYLDNPKLSYSAQELQEVGVKFIEKKASHLLDISFDFHKGVLQIPPLSIDKNMTVALLNFVAYEQCDLSQSPYFTNYLLFLDCLINTTKDVEILRKNKIIWYPLGMEKEVVDLFNNFCKGMLCSFDQTYLSIDMKVVNNYCKAFYESKWRFWWSNFKRERFSSPWTYLSLVAAIVLLILIMIQTYKLRTVEMIHWSSL